MGVAHKGTDYLSTFATEMLHVPAWVIPHHPPCWSSLYDMQAAIPLKRPLLTTNSLLLT